MFLNNTSASTAITLRQDLILNQRSTPGTRLLIYFVDGPETHASIFD